MKLKFDFKVLRSNFTDVFLSYLYFFIQIQGMNIKNNHKGLIIISGMFLVIIIAGCTQQAEIKNIVIGNVEYSFSEDVRQSIKIPVNDAPLVRNIIDENRDINVVFDCSASTEKPYISVAAYNIVSKIQNYVIYSRYTYAKFSTFCYVGNDWYNSTDNKIEKPDFTSAVIWFKGPATGAESTSVTAYNNTILIQGTSYRNMTLAADAFSLAMLGITEDAVSKMK